MPTVEFCMFYDRKVAKQAKSGGENDGNADVQWQHK